MDPQCAPYYNNAVKAGFPSPAEEEMATPLNLHSHLITHPHATFFVRVLGDSMEGAGIFDGDMLIVDKAATPSHGKVVVALIQGEFTVKRLIIDDHGVMLKPENPRYKAVRISQGQDLTIWGVVTYVIHKP
jgi:DNA polymerase V